MRFFVIIALVVCGACSENIEPPVMATDVVITRAMPAMNMSAGYLTLTNNTSTVVRISRVVSEQYESVELHESIVQDGVARMRSLPELEIGAGETVTLEPGGKHLMLMRPKGVVKNVTLQFLSGDDLILTVNASIDIESD